MKNTLRFIYKLVSVFALSSMMLSMSYANNFATSPGLSIIQKDLKEITDLSICLSKGYPKIPKTEPTGFSTFTITVPGPFPIPNHPAATYTLIAKGNPNNPLAFIVHGFPDSPKSMRFLMDKLANNGYYAVAPYLRGYSPTQSGLVPPAQMLQTVTTDLIILSNILANPSKANVYIGHDWGSLLGQSVVAFTGPIYKKFVSMGNILPLPVLESAINNFSQNQASFYIFYFQITPDMGSFLSDLGLGTFRSSKYIENLWKSWEPLVGATLDPLSVAAVNQALLSDLSNVNLKNALNYYRNVYTLPPDGFSTVLSQPSLYFIGMLDGSLIFPKDPVLMAQLLQMGRDTKIGGPIKYEMLPCSGHFPQVSDPVNVSNKILQFLAE